MYRIAVAAATCISIGASVSYVSYLAVTKYITNAEDIDVQKTNANCEPLKGHAATWIYEYCFGDWLSHRFDEPERMVSSDAPDQSPNNSLQSSSNSLWWDDKDHSTDPCGDYYLKDLELRAAKIATLDKSCFPQLIGDDEDLKRIIEINRKVGQILSKTEIGRELLEKTRREKQTDEACCSGKQ
jgi:hypothetical protein